MQRQSFEVSGGILSVILLGALCLPSYGQVLVWGDNTYGQTNVPLSATNVIAVAAGDYHCLALRSDGSVITWGQQSDGLTNVPGDLSNIVSVAAGNTHSLALRNDGTVAIWGRWISGISTTVPPEATNIVGLALGPGAAHALAVRADGSVLDWGYPYYALTNPPPTVRNVVAVAAGSFHAVALRSDGKVVAWGDNSSGQTNVPPNATNIVAVAAGWYGNAALRADGTVLVWGQISSPIPIFGFTNLADLACPFDGISVRASLLGMRHNGTAVESGATLPKYPTNNVTAIGAGSYNGLMVTGNGPPVFPGLPVNRTVPSGTTAYFRMNAVGALPMFYQWTCNGTNLPAATNSVLILTNVQPEMAGTTYALIATNALGVATSAPMSLNETPFESYLAANTSSAVVDQMVTLSAATIGLPPFTYQWQFYGTNLLSATNSTLTLTNAQLADAGLYAVVISNAFGMVTDAISLSVTPTILTNSLRSQTSFPNGTATFSIGLRAIVPVAYQWQFNGVNLDGATNNTLVLTDLQSNQAGTYRVIFTDAFETVTNEATLSVLSVVAWGNAGKQSLSLDLTNVVAISLGQNFGLGLNADSTLSPWGMNGYIAAPPPPGLSNVIAIAAGNSHGLVLKDDGTAVAWGNNSYGQTNVPPDLTNIVAIAAGDFHNLVLKADGSVVVWGNNAYGQTNVPAGLTNTVAIAAGEWNSMALRADGTVVAWGAGTNKTSDPNFGQSVVPTVLTNVVQIATGGPDDLALTADGLLVGWGGNFYGENTPPVGLSNIVMVASGYGHTVVLKTDGTVTAWGENQLGETTVPVGLTNVVAVAARGFQSAALIGDGPPPAQVLVSNPKLTERGFSLSLPSQVGRVYALQYTTSPLAESNWIGLHLAAGNGRTLTLTDPTPANSERFYRVLRR